MPLKLKQGKVLEFGAFTLSRQDNFCRRATLLTPRLLNFSAYNQNLLLSLTFKKDHLVKGLGTNRLNDNEPRQDTI